MSYNDMLPRESISHTANQSLASAECFLLDAAMIGIIVPIHNV
jgi:hypothetical protein